MALMIVLYLLLRIIPGHDSSNVHSIRESCFSSPIPDFHTETTLPVTFSDIFSKSSPKDTLFKQKLLKSERDDSFSFFSHSFSFISLVLVSTTIGFFYGTRKISKKNSENLLQSPISKSSTIVSSMPSPNFFIENCEMEPIFPNYSYELIDGLIDNCGYKKNFDEERLLWENSEEKVFLARHKLDKGLYLVKLMPIEVNLMDSLENWTIFQEINKIKKIDCKHIARYVTCWVESNKAENNLGFVGLFLYVQMEFIEGQPLLQYLQDKHFEKNISLKFLKQICKTINYLHKKGVPHGDISPENIFIDRYSKVRIGDFNLKNCMCYDKKGFLSLVSSVFDNFSHKDKQEITEKLLDLEFVKTLNLWSEITALLG